MKIHYTLPGYQPELKLSTETSGPLSSRFRTALPAVNGQASASLRQALALDRTAPDPTLLAPPPQSSSQRRDPAAERQLWRSILTRHSQPGEIAQAAPAVRKMLTLLDGYQQTEAMLLANGLSQDKPS